ncbi:hypothetical protein [Zestomonas carbonaria]|uniref:Uncharacterized protein n=1 Tax=Zestomonas carbonaria TaxID=2762745 RepID=A0A7U7EQE7_9GAMM|nr:hypothetical protein [Pseudomonas carbonaria]CAD5109277.1 hypothetical protein PSEWESI4_03573 [Pseudomonas carbonaria]
MSEIVAGFLAVGLCEIYPAQDCDEAIFAIDNMSLPFDVLVYSEELGGAEYARLFSRTQGLKRIHKVLLLVSAGRESNVLDLYNAINALGGMILGFVDKYEELERLNGMVLERFPALVSS